MNNNDLFKFPVPNSEGDYFINYECPFCEEEFERLDFPNSSIKKIFCPFCGEKGKAHKWAAGLTNDQIERTVSVYEPEIRKGLQDVLAQKLKGLGMEFKLNPAFRVELDPLPEGDKMVIITPSCHPTEQIGIPSSSLQQHHCTICGELF